MGQEKFFSYAELEFIRGHESVEGSDDQSDSGVANRVPAQLGKNAIWIKERLELVENLRSVLKVSTPGELQLNKGYIIEAGGEYTTPATSAAGDVLNIRAKSSGVKIVTDKVFSNRLKTLDLMNGRTISLVLSEDGTTWMNSRQEIDGFSYSLKESDEKFETLEGAAKTAKEMIERIALKLDISAFNTELESLNLRINDRQTIAAAKTESTRVDKSIATRQSIADAEKETDRVNLSIATKQSVDDASRIESELRARINTKADDAATNASILGVKKTAEAARTEQDALVETQRVNNELGLKVLQSSYDQRQTDIDNYLGQRVEKVAYSADQELVNKGIGERQTILAAQTETSRVNLILADKVGFTAYNQRQAVIDTEFGKRVLSTDYVARNKVVDDQLALKETKSNATTNYNNLMTEINKKGSTTDITASLLLKADKDSVWTKAEADSRFINVTSIKGENDSADFHWIDIGQFVGAGTTNLMFRVKSGIDYHSLDALFGEKSFFGRGSEYSSDVLMTDVKEFSSPSGVILAVRFAPRTTFEIFKMESDGTFDFLPPTPTTSTATPQFSFSIPTTASSFSDEVYFGVAHLGSVSLSPSVSKVGTLMRSDITQKVMNEVDESGAAYFDADGNKSSSVGLNGHVSYSGANYLKFVIDSGVASILTDLTYLKVNKEVRAPSLKSDGGAYLGADGFSYSKDGKLGLEVGSETVDFKVKSIRAGSTADGVSILKNGSSYEINRTSASDPTLILSRTVSSTRTVQLTLNSAADFGVDLKEKGFRVFSRGNKVQWDDSDIDNRPRISKGTTGDVATVQVDEVKGGWAGYSIMGRYAFIGDASGGYGLFNDVSSKWLIKGSGVAFELHHDGYPLLTSTDGGLVLQSRDSNIKTTLLVSADSTSFNSSSKKYSFDKQVEAPSLLVGTSGIDAANEVFEKGVRVYSPNNKPSALEIGMVSKEDAEKWLAAEGRMRSWVLESGSTTTLPEGDWWDVGTLSNKETSVKFSFLTKTQSTTEGLQASKRLDVEVVGDGHVNGLLQCEGEVGSAGGDFLIYSEGGEVRIWMRLQVQSYADVSSHCFGPIIGWVPSMTRSTVAPSPQVGASSSLDTRDIGSVGIYRMLTGDKCRVFDSVNLPTPSEIGAAEAGGSTNRDFSVHKLILASGGGDDLITCGESGEGSEFYSLKCYGGTLTQRYDNLEVEILIGDGYEYKFNCPDTVGEIFTISSEKLKVYMPMVQYEDGKELPFYSTQSVATKKKLRNYESSGYDFSQTDLLFNSKSLLSTDGTVIKLNSAGQFTSIEMKLKVLIKNELSFDLDSKMTANGKSFLKVVAGGDIYLGGAGRTLYLGKSAQSDMTTTSIQLEADLKNSAGTDLLKATGEVYDKGARVYSPDNKPTPNDIGAANQQGDTSTDFNARNVTMTKAVTDTTETKVLKIGSIELRQNPDGSLGFYI